MDTYFYQMVERVLREELAVALGNRSRKPAGVCWRFCAEAAWVLFGAYIQFKGVVVVGSISYIYYLVLIDQF